MKFTQRQIVIKYIDIISVIVKSLFFGFEILIVLSVFNRDITFGFISILVIISIDIIVWAIYGRSSVFKNIAFGSFILLFIGVGGTYSIIYNIIRYSNIWKSLKVGDASDWIGFSGSIIGGLMTMFALVFTIQHENQKRKQERIEQLKPYIDIDCERLNVKQSELVTDWLNERQNLRLEISNISTNNTRDFQIIEIKRDYCDKTLTSEINEIERKWDDQLVKNSNISLIKSNYSSQLFLGFADIPRAKIAKTIDIPVVIELISQYYDVSGNGPYRHSTKIDLNREHRKTKNNVDEKYIIQKITNRSI